MVSPELQAADLWVSVTVILTMVVWLKVMIR